MPLLDSFTVDHTRMEAPAVRVAKTMNTPHGDAITVFDLRFCVPNKEVMPERGSIPWSTCLLVLCVTILTVMA
ncbi:hypothetical protein MUTS16_63690 [Escherichia coli]|nr:hypothetical protein MUTS16_63690 [Escherichia coli]